MEEEVYNKIISKKEFSDLPKEDVEKIYSLFARRQTDEEEKIRLTRDLLRKVYSAFSSDKLYSPSLVSKKNAEEIMNKHISTKERIPFFNEVYSIIFSKFKADVIFDFGAGINGVSFPILSKYTKAKYLAVEAVGQKVNVMNDFFKKEKIKSALALKGSLFNLEFINNLISKEKGKKGVFLFKTLDSLEMVEHNFSKRFLTEIVPKVDWVVVSFATKSLVSKKSFSVKRYWFDNFLTKSGWKVIDNFEIGYEKYIVFSK